MQNPYSLKEISTIANVSMSTASRFLSNPDSVKDSTRKKIQLAMRAHEMHISKKKSNIIGFVAPDLTNQFFLQLLKGMESVASSHNQMLIICDSLGSEEKEGKVISNLLSMNIDGLICICASENSSTLELLVKEKTIPIVFLDRKPNIKNISSVTSDGVNGMYQGTKFLLTLGHERIMYLGGVQNTSTENDRYKGFKAAFEDSHLTFDEKDKFYANYDRDYAYSLVCSLIRDKSFPYTAIACTNDLMAIGAYRALTENHISIPDDVSILGYDDIPSAELLHLTTIKQPFNEIGSTAMLQLLDAISEPYRPVKETVLPSSIVIRDSCKHPKL